jgi:hypothetical protein
MNPIASTMAVFATQRDCQEIGGPLRSALTCAHVMNFGAAHLLLV